MNCCTNVGGARQGGMLIDEARVDAGSLRLKTLSLLEVADECEDAMLGDLVFLGWKRRAGGTTVSSFDGPKKLSGDVVRTAGDEN